MTETIKRNGEVVGFARGMAQVRLERDAGCSACGSRATCASGNSAAELIRLSLPAHTHVGDRVTVSIPAASLTLAAVLGYLLPPVSLLAGAIAANILFGNDVAAVLGAGAGFASGLLLARVTSSLAFGKEFSTTLCRPDFQSGEHS